MRTIAMKEASARLPELCDAVARTGEPVQITRQGRPVAVIAPWHDPARQPVTVWEDRAEFEQQHGPLDEDFELPVRAVDEQTWRTPLD